MATQKRAAKPVPERRVLSSIISIRRAPSGKRTIYGYAAKFAPVQSADMGGWTEEIHPNAFDSCLRSTPDVVGLWNHDVNHVLGRTTSGTLHLSVDKTGLLYAIEPPNTQLAKDLMELMERGDIHQSSFGFYCIEDSWREGPNGTYIRTVLKAELFDVSPVTFPAYPDATSGVRASLRSAPAAIREAIKAKSKKRDDLDEDIDPACDPDDPAFDPLADCDDEEQDSRKDADAELDTLRLRLKIATHRAKRFSN